MPNGTTEDVQRRLAAGSIREDQAVDLLTQIFMEEQGMAEGAARYQAQAWVDTWAGRGVDTAPEMRPIGREAAIGEQEIGALPDVWQRYLLAQPEYKGAVGYAQRGMERPGRRLETQYKLGQTFLPGEDFTFTRFLEGPRPTPANIGAQLRTVEDVLRSSPQALAGLASGVEEAMRSMYGTEYEGGAGRQFQASLQAMLGQMSPYIRPHFERGAQRRASQFTAAYPETDWLTEARRLGYY